MTTKPKQTRVPPMAHGEILRFAEDGWIVRGHLTFDELVFAFADDDRFRTVEGDDIGFDLFGMERPSEDGHEWPAIAEYFLSGEHTRITREYGRRLSALPNDDYTWCYWPAKKGQRGATAYTLIY